MKHRPLPPSSASLRPATGQRGGTTGAFVVGLVVGLAIALVVALYITKAELPFSNAKTQAASPNLKPGDGKSTPPDPNGSIYNRTGGAAPGMSDLAAQPTPPAPASAPSAGNSINSSTQAPAPAQAVSQTQYFLQLGSFRNREDAENLRARLAFVGSEAEIAIGQVNGEEVNRVRVGPFNSANEAYQARVPLTKSGFEATVVKQ